MKSNLLVLLSLAAAWPVLAAGPQPTGMFRIVKPDGATVIKQAMLTTNPGVMGVISVDTKDAFFSAIGRCAFNVTYDEVSDTAATDTTNRLYANDKLIAQNTHIDLKPKVMRTIWTQPYLSPGQNNVKVVINADSASPGVAWVRVNVGGTCGATPTPAPTPVVEKKAPPPPPPPPPPPVKYGPGSAQWNTLYTAWGYSNYAATQLKGRNYARYGEVSSLNAELSAVVKAGSVEQPAYNSLMERWNRLCADPAFKAAMAAITPPAPGRK